MLSVTLDLSLAKSRFTLAYQCFCRGRVNQKSSDILKIYILNTEKSRNDQMDCSCTAEIKAVQEES